MPIHRPVLGRRPALGLLLGLPVIGIGALGYAQIPAFPEGASLLAAGPEASDIDSWARLIAPYLRRALPADTPLRRAPAGGVDGVTGANHFHTSAQPDGFSLLLAPGSAALAWLFGDPRVHFDAGRWIGLLAGHSPAVLISRFDPRGFRRGQALRVAVGTPQGPDAAALLGLELMGLEPMPVTGPAGTGAALTAFAQHAADLLMLGGRGLTEQLAAANAAGGQPICVLGVANGTGFTHDPVLPGLPHLAELAGEIGLPMTGGPLGEAWQAIAAAAQLNFALVLPPLTTAAMVALWRRTTEATAVAAELQAAATEEGVRLRASQDGITAINVDPAALRELRTWLAAVPRPK